jgi:hypothetical protein
MNNIYHEQNLRMRSVSRTVWNKHKTYIIGDGRCESKNKTGESSIDSWSKDRYESHQTNNNRREQVETYVEPSINCIKRHKHASEVLHNFDAHLPTSNKMGLYSMTRGQRSFSNGLLWFSPYRHISAYHVGTSRTPQKRAELLPQISFRRKSNIRAIA